MKICFPVFSLGEAGGERVVALLAEGLARRGHDVCMIVPRGTSRLFLPNKNLVSIKEVFYHFPKINLITNSIALALNTPRCDIICATAGLTSLACLIATNMLKRGKPYYYIQHYEPLFYRGFLRAPYRTLIKSSYSFFDLFSTDSNWLNERIFRETGRKGTIIHPGIDARVFYSREIVKDIKHKIVLYLGRKGALRAPEVFFNAVTLIGKRIPNLKVVNVTQDKWSHDLQCAYEERKASGVELARLYSLADVYVLSSNLEGFPLPPLEAMACGAPVVTTDCLGIRDYAIHDRNALIVRPGKPLLLSRAIVRLLSETGLSKKLIKNGMETAKRFTVGKTIDKFEATFQKVLKS